MSNKESTLIEGDLKVISSSEPSIYGDGSIDISGNLNVSGTITSGGGGAGGETNTASNIGTAGVGVFSQKVGSDLQFKNINSGSSKITVTNDAPNNEIDLDISEVNIIHQNLSGAGTNTHAQIDSHIASTANPHSVTIDQITPTTTKGDLLVEDGANVVRLGVGTNGQVLVADSAQATGLRWETGGAISVAIIKDLKPVGTNGGNFISGAWRIRTLNDITGNAGSNVSLATNQITLAPGNYHIKASAPADRVDSHQTRLFDVTNSTVVALGSTEFSRSNREVYTSSFIVVYISISVPTVYRLEHICQTSTNGSGLGRAAGFSDEVYSQVEIVKI